MTEQLISMNLKNGAFRYSHALTQSPNDSQHRSYLTDSYQLFYLISGNVLYQVEGQSYPLKPGDLLILNNKEIHRPYFASNEKYERILVFFTPEFCSHYSDEEYSLLQYFEKRKPGSFNRLTGELVEKENLSGYFHRIEGHIKDNQPKSKIMVELTFIELLIHINEIISTHEDFNRLELNTNKKMELIIKYINDNLFRPISLNEIQDALFINKYYFSHTFKKVTGVSFKEYVIRKRVAKAAELLKLGISPSEVFRMTGFEDYSNFYKAFKRILGMAPSQYH